MTELKNKPVGMGKTPQQILEAWAKVNTPAKPKRRRKPHQNRNKIDELFPEETPLFGENRKKM